MMRKVLRVNEFSFILCVRLQPQSRQGTSKTASFSLLVMPFNTIPSPMSLPDAQAAKKKKSSWRRNCLTAVRAVLISVRCYVTDNMKNVSSPCAESEVTVDVT